jgi:hypothetical protein
MKPARLPPAWRLLAALWLLGAAAARAHDPYLSYTEVTVRPREIEVDCTMARFTATRLLLANPASAQAAPAMLTPDNFNDFVPPLKKEAEKLFELTAGGKPLAPREVDVELNEDGDGVDFTIIYARPPAGPLRLGAVYIKLLPDDGYATALTVFDDARRVLNAGKSLDMETLTFDLIAPPPAARAAPSAAPSASP